MFTCTRKSRSVSGALNVKREGKQLFVIFWWHFVSNSQQQREKIFSVRCHFVVLFRIFLKFFLVISHFFQSVFTSNGVLYSSNFLLFFVVEPNVYQFTCILTDIKCSFFSLNDVKHSTKRERERKRLGHESKEKKSMKYWAMWAKRMTNTLYMRNNCYTLSRFPQCTNSVDTKNYWNERKIKHVKNIFMHFSTDAKTEKKKQLTATAVLIVSHIFFVRLLKFFGLDFLSFRDFSSHASSFMKKKKK